ncbi:protein LNK2-like isoform X1 [Senna tora]|uniref:Protein LNK2-like isoform X1 n=1 Tax=Senna tora TaxID=362788 RepID=A0A835CAI1_9FABA|nr:protein LNK2-like isoform X1 [Senna tora]
MFDWNDEELTNIIWGEATESDDHIVPFSVASEDLCNKKEWNQEAAGVTLTEQKRSEAKIDFQGRKLGSSSNIDNSKGYGVNSWPDLSLSTAAKTDQGSRGTELSKSLSKISKYSSSREEAAQPAEDDEIFQKVQEGKEQGDLIDYGWANIGSFDDLDRIFSNDDPIFGHASIDNTDELWSSRDDSLDPTPAGDLRNRSEPSETKAECVQHDDDQFFTFHYEKIGGPASHDIQNAHERTVDVGYAGVRSKLTVKEQLTNQNTAGRTTSVTSGLASENVATVNKLTNKDVIDTAFGVFLQFYTSPIHPFYFRLVPVLLPWMLFEEMLVPKVLELQLYHCAFGQKNLLKARKKIQGKQEGKMMQKFYGSWSPSTNQLRQFENQMAPSATQASPSSILGQQKQLQPPETLYQDIANPYVASPLYGNLTNTYPTMPLPSQAQSLDVRQPLLSGYEVSPGIVNPVKKSVGSVKPLTMTPQEKIEKLRRRQQLQAMLAIQKQKQHLGHQVLSTNESIPQQCPLEIQSHSFEGIDPGIEDLSSLPAPDPPVEQDDSNTISVAVDDYFDEDAILYRLQDIISKLDIKIRLCIRDSLFRLAQSAMQRHYASDTSSANKSSREELEVVAREESNLQNRYPKMTNAETETNPIDRTVAHLLFHRPLEFRGNHPEKLESPVSAKIQRETKATNLANFPVECLPTADSKSNNQPFSLPGFENSRSLFEAQPMDQFKTSPCIDPSENASNTESANVGIQELEERGSQ